MICSQAARNEPSPLALRGDRWLHVHNAGNDPAPRPTTEKNMPRPRKTTTPADAKAAALAAALDAARKRLLRETLDTPGRDALDFHDLAVGLLREALAAMFDAGYAAAPLSAELVG